MHRRRFLSSLVGLSTVALAGCVTSDGGAGSDDNGSPTDGDATTETRSTDAEPTVTDRTFRRREDCRTRDDATVTFESDAVNVVGCLTGPNGCSEARLREATLDGDALRVVVETFSDAGTDVACTEALVYRGYEVTVRFSRALPERVTVVHDDVDGEHVVAEATR